MRAPTPSPLRMARAAAAYSAGPAMKASAPLARRKRGKAGSTVPFATSSCALTGPGGGSTCLTNSTRCAPILPASQAARLSLVTSQDHGMSFAAHTIRVADQTVTPHAANSCRGCYKLQLSSEIRERVAILVHGKQRHPVGGAIVEAHSGLGRTYRVGERTASWHHNHSPGASSDRIDPIFQIARE